MVDKNLLNAITKLRGIGKKPQTTETVSLENEVSAENDLSQGAPENMQALTDFLNNPASAPTEVVEKKYTMQDLDNFIENLKKTE